MMEPSEREPPTKRVKTESIDNANVEHKSVRSGVAGYFDDVDDGYDNSEEAGIVSAASILPQVDVIEAKVEPETKTVATSELNVENVIDTISKHLCNDKKFVKASGLFCKLIDSELNNSNAASFFSCLCRLMCECASRDVTDKLYRDSYVSLFDSVNKKLGCFDSDEQYILQTYAFYAQVRNLLLTDDSFQYSKAVGLIKSTLQTISSTSDMSESQMNRWEERQRVLICCIETALANYKWSWAKQPCDSLISVVSEKRMLFGEGVREQLDDLVNSVVALQRKNASWIGPKTFRAFDSTSHPLRSKKIEYGAV
jgi:hypothetical protein